MKSAAPSETSACVRKPAACSVRSRSIPITAPRTVATTRREIRSAGVPIPVYSSPVHLDACFPGVVARGRERRRMQLDDLIVYARGGFTRYADAKIGLLTHALQYGTGCFEGVRGFWDQDERELYILHARDHYRRLHDSAKILMMKVPKSPDELVEITTELCARNKFECEVYIRPFVYKADEAIGVRLEGVKDEFAIVAIPFVGYFGEAKGLRTCLSSWRRIDDTVAPARAKITGIYINSALAKSEAQLGGFDEAILLSHDGHVAEGSADNIFLVREGVLYTPDASQNILEGITRKS